ncbi:hypothetical protein M3Y98_00446000 [Aphelenchoides besseyi]|nr:hypothetical protein M3Y98_00446000 [Aphelenchoides besseyi]KAI6202591.1 hypothetical protein M3Y96_00965000 [Aphelenchoides besseyi]
MSIRLISLTTIFVLGLLLVSNVEASCCCGGCCGCGCGGCGCCQPCANCLPCGNPPLLIKLPPTPPKLCCCCCKPCCCGCCPCCSCCGCGGGRKRRSILPENRLSKQHLCTKATRNCKRCAAVMPTTLVSSTVDKVENKPKKSENKIRARRQAFGQMFGQSLGLMPSYRSSLKFAPIASNCECI